MQKLAQLATLPLFPLSEKQTEGGLIQLQAALSNKKASTEHIYELC